MKRTFNVETYAVQAVLKNGGEVLKRRTRPDIAREIVLCYLPWNEFTPFATWERNPEDGDTYWGHYFQQITEAEKDFEIRGK